MSATAWVNAAGAAIVNGSGELVLCVRCPCPGQHISACNGIYGVPAALIITLTFNGFSKSVPLNWFTAGASSSCFGEGWEYNGGEQAITTGLAIQGVSMCCGSDFPGIWHLSIDLRIDGFGGQEFTTNTPGGGLVPIIGAPSPPPIAYTSSSTNTITANGVTDTLAIAIVPP